MNCFYHPGIAAVGICKSCAKGLCLECAVDVGKGLACKGRCEKDVKDVIRLIDHNLIMIGTSQKILGNSRKTYFGNGIFYLAFGLLALVVGIAICFAPDGWYGGIFTIILATMFLIFGIFYLKRGFSFPAQKSSEDMSR